MNGTYMCNSTLFRLKICLREFLQHFLLLMLSYPVQFEWNNYVGFLFWIQCKSVVRNGRRLVTAKRATDYNNNVSSILKYRTTKQTLQHPENVTLFDWENKSFFRHLSNLNGINQNFWSSFMFSVQKWLTGKIYFF